MTDRVQNLVDAGRLSREPASDDEVAGLWTNAVQAFRDALVESVSANGRLLRAYDAGRIAAAAIVRSRDLRVRAANHHELTLAVAALVSGAELAKAFSEMDGMRRLRADLEYGWQAGASENDVQRALDVVRRILRGGSVELVATRQSLNARLPEH
ncbi:MAG TPA: hypothetical protein VEQ60_11090 [Longimicrobium sp.]|nr:hypothetical protein [Longimicrobium sp.]